MNPKICEHESSTAHIKSFTQWKELPIRICHGTTIDRKEQQVVESHVKKWKETLSRLLDITRLLAKQNLAFRSHREGMKYERHETDVEHETMENRGNFSELVHLLANYDLVLREHLIRIQLGNKFATSYLSLIIKNEFIEVLGENVRSKDIKQIKQAKYFSMIFDSTSDISQKYLTTQASRYVIIDGDNMMVVESLSISLKQKVKLPKIFHR